MKEVEGRRERKTQRQQNKGGEDDIDEETEDDDQDDADSDDDADKDDNDDTDDDDGKPCMHPQPTGSHEPDRERSTCARAIREQLTALVTRSCCCI